MAIGISCIVTADSSPVVTLDPQYEIFRDREPSPVFLRDREPSPVFLVNTIYYLCFMWMSPDIIRT